MDSDQPPIVEFIFLGTARSHQVEEDVEVEAVMVREVQGIPQLAVGRQHNLFRPIFHALLDLRRECSKVVCRQMRA